VGIASGNTWSELCDETDTDALIAFLRKVLVLDPASRPTATEILQDPWFKSLKLQCEQSRKMKMPSLLIEAGGPLTIRKSTTPP
jgi:serine/threonine protein kinase